MNVQLLLEGMEEVSLTVQEKNFCHELVYGVDDDGQPISATEAAFRTTKAKTKGSARTAASRMLQGGKATLSLEKRTQKQQAMQAYIDRLVEQKRQSNLFDIERIAQRLWDVVEIGLGEKTIKQTVVSSEGQTDIDVRINKLAATNSALDTLAKLGGHMVDKKEVTGKDGKPLEVSTTARRVEYVDVDGTLIDD